MTACGEERYELEAELLLNGTSEQLVARGRKLGSRAVATLRGVVSRSVLCTPTGDAVAEWSSWLTRLNAALNRLASRLFAIRCEREATWLPRALATAERARVQAQQQLGEIDGIFDEWLSAEGGRRLVATLQAAATRVSHF